MPIGVEKVGLVNPNDKRIKPVAGSSKKYPAVVMFPADIEIEFEAIYYKDTPENKKGRAKWVVKPFNDLPIDAEDKREHVGDRVSVKIEAKYCGPGRYKVLEAFLNKPESKYPTMILLLGEAPMKIKTTKWSAEKEGADIRQSPVKYGDNVWLNIETEGLNGTTLEVDVFNKATGSDIPVHTYHNVKCRGGVVNYNIKNTYLWRKKTGIWTSSKEEFYIKIRLKGNKEYLKDDKGQTPHARYLRIEDKISKRTVEESSNALPLKTGKEEVNLERYEPCRFSSLTIIDEGKKIVLFDEGKLKLKGEVKKEFPVSEKIYFDYDKAIITSEAKKVLNPLATFLKDNAFVPVELGAHCDVRGTDAYNDALSLKRATASVNYLKSKGVTNKINAKGYGKRKLLIKGSENELTEEQHKQNRRVTIKFKIFGGDSQSIVYETIAPDDDTKKEITLKIGDYNTDKCFQEKIVERKHETDFRIIEMTQNGKKYSPVMDGKSDVKYKVYSKLSGEWYSTMPLKYIFPHKIIPNQFLYHPHSCRYYSDNTKASVIVKVYPDIKWEFSVFLNLSNDLSVKWQNMPYGKSVKPENLGFGGEKNLHARAGKMGAEKRWKYTDIDFGAVLQAKWNKTGKDSYARNEKLTAKFDAKIKALYKIFGQLKEASKYITNATKATIVKTKIGSKLPVTIEMRPPNFAIGAEWQLARGVKNNKPIKELGTDIKLFFKAEPLIGLELTLDLLGLAIGLTGPAAPVLHAVRNWMGEGENISLDIYINLVLSGMIKIPDLSLAYNTASDNTDPNRKVNLEADATIELKLEAGLFIKAKVVIVIAEFYASGKAHIEGKGSITFGHKITYKSDKLVYRPKLLFDGIHAKILIKAEVGITIKKGWFSGNHSKELADFHDKFDTPQFDIIKKIEELTGLDANITLIE